MDLNAEPELEVVPRDVREDGQALGYGAAVGRSREVLVLRVWHAPPGLTHHYVAEPLPTSAMCCSSWLDQLDERVALLIPGGDWLVAIVP